MLIIAGHSMIKQDIDYLSILIWRFFVMYYEFIICRCNCCHVVYKCEHST